MGDERNPFYMKLRLNKVSIPNEKKYEPLEGVLKERYPEVYRLYNEFKGTKQNIFDILEFCGKALKMVDDPIVFERLIMGDNYTLLLPPRYNSAFNTYSEGGGEL